MSRAPITKTGSERLRAELERLKSIERPRIIAAIAEARAHGDLKENAEYHIAKEDQAHLETKIKRLRARLRDAVVVAAEDGEPDRFAFGRTAEVADDAGAVHTWTLVGATEADMSAGRLSAESPVGRALRDGRIGTEIAVETPRGPRTFTIRKLIG